jgi:hypothetical protein
MWRISLDKLEQLRWIVEGRLRQTDSPDRQAAYRHVLEDIGQLRGNTYLFESPRGRFVATLEAENAEKLRQELQKALKTVEEMVEHGAELGEVLDGTKAYVGVYDMDACDPNDCADCEDRDSCDTYKRYQEEKGVNG